MCVNRARPTACKVIPATSIGFGPTRVTTREASVEQATMHRVIGKKAKPARSGE